MFSLSDTRRPTTHTNGPRRSKPTCSPALPTRASCPARWGVPTATRCLPAATKPTRTSSSRTFSADPPTRTPCCGGTASSKPFVDCLSGARDLIVPLSGDKLENHLVDKGESPLVSLVFERVFGYARRV